eukprot:7302409-Lingulodinium_polyedra.AAC.1
MPNNSLRITVERTRCSTTFLAGRRRGANERIKYRVGWNLRRLVETRVLEVVILGGGGRDVP